MPEWAKTENAIFRDIKIRTESTTTLQMKGPAIFGFSRELKEGSEPILPEDCFNDISSTLLGHRVARLYLNPISGRMIHDGIQKCNENNDWKTQMYANYLQ